MTFSRSPTLDEVISAGIESYLNKLHTALPGRVETYDAAKQEADIKPLVNRLIATSEEGGELLESLPTLPSVPIIFPRGGGYHLTFPIKAGDHVLLVFNESSIDKFMTSSNSAEVDPGTFQRFDLSDAVAYAGFYPDGGRIDADADDMTMGHDTGATIHITEELVNLGEKAPAEFVVLANKLLTRIAVMENIINTHMHTTVMGPSGTLIVPLAPTTQLADISAQKVKAA